MIEIKPATNIIENENGQFRSARGPDAIYAYQLRILIEGLRLEAAGIRVARGISCLKKAKSLTGLKTNDRAQQAARIKILLDEALAKCLIITDGQ